MQKRIVRVPLAKLLLLMVVAPIIVIASRSAYCGMAPYKPIAADVIGTYRANTSPAHWYLILEKNGVYEQLFYPSTKVAIKNSGHWTLDCDIGDGNCSIGLDNAIVDEDNASMGSERGHWNIDVGRAFFGGPVLVIDDDQDLYLEKID